MQGDRGDGFYVLARGRVSVLVAGADGAETQVNELKAGDWYA